MAYQLKTTGIAANCTMLIAVDPDTMTVKDFTSPTVTSTMAVGANVTIGSQAWDGNTRHYYRPGAGTTDADFVKFTTNLPNFLFNTSGQTRTVVFIGEVTGAQSRVFGLDSVNYICSQDTGSGGATYPLAKLSSVASSGGFTARTAGNKVIFGFSLVHSTSSVAYAAADTDAAMSKTTATNLSPNLNFGITYVNRRNDSTAHQQDKTHAILIFNTALTEAEWDSLRDDWFGALLEPASVGSTNGTATGTPASISLIAPAAIGTGTGGATNGSGTGVPSSLSMSAPAASGTGTLAGSGTITTPALRNNTGTVLASISGWGCNVYAATTGAFVIQKTGLTTSAGGVLTITDAAISAGTTYAYEPFHATYGRRLPTSSAA